MGERGHPTELVLTHEADTAEDADRVLPETTDAGNFGELVRAAAGDLAGRLLGRRSLQVATRPADQ